MWIKLGNISPKEGYRNTVDPDAFTLAELKDECIKYDIPADGDKKTLARYLSDIVRYKKIDSGNKVVVTKFAFPDEGISLVEAIRSIKDVYMQAHSYSPPEWVESNNDIFAELVSAEFNCPIGRPLDQDVLENNII